MRFRVVIFSIFLLSAIGSRGQVLLKTYYDDAQTQLKEEFYVRSQASNVLHGAYKSYFTGGGIKSEGQFINNKSTGIWKYYYENGRLRMQGQIDNGKSVGQWEYFYENGNLKMKGELIEGKKDGYWLFYYKNGAIESEGEYIQGKKSGIWKYYHPSGVLKAMEEFSGLGSYYEEVYESGGIKSEGRIANGKKEGEWLFYHEDGTLKAKGNFVDNMKNGTWQFFDYSGKIEAEGRYINDLANGIWIYYHTDGSIASQGELVEGKKNGSWKMFYNDGTLKGEALYNRGDGEYREYYKDGALKVKGMVQNGLNHGRWQYFYENGNLEGECDFNMGEGNYLGYYNDGSLKMKGHIKNEKKTGIWELYESSGELTGYYKPYYEEGEATFFLAEDVQEQKALSQVRRERARAGSFRPPKKKSRYFRKKFHEYKALIIGYNPVAPLVGSLPFSFEYYMEERLGYELALQYLRRPFFRSFSSVSEGDSYSEGFAVTFRQKFYHQESPWGQPYFAHELKYTTLFHSTNIASEQVFGAHEQKIEYAGIVGTRFFKNVTSNGFTIDAYVGFGVGYRNFDQAYQSDDPANDPFRSLNNNDFAYSIRIGVNLGYAFRIRR